MKKLIIWIVLGLVYLFVFYGLALYSIYLGRTLFHFSSQDQALCAITTFGVGLALLFIVLEFVALKAAINADKRRND